MLSGTALRSAAQPYVAKPNEAALLSPTKLSGCSGRDCPSRNRAAPPQHAGRYYTERSGRATQDGATQDKTRQSGETALDETPRHIARQGETERQNSITLDCTKHSGTT